MNNLQNIRERNNHLSGNYLLNYGFSETNAGSGRKMYWSNKYILCLLLGSIFLSAFSAKPEEVTIKYSIHILGANVGEFTVTQTSMNGNVIIEAITEVNINMLFSYRIKYDQNTVYKAGVLQNAQVEMYKNGKLNSTMWMRFDKGSYLLVIDGDTTVINELITYSGSLIYFNEPIESKRIFKERNAEMRQITPVSEHIYIIKDEKNREINRYYYENGILSYAQMRHALGNVELKRVNE